MVAEKIRCRYCNWNIVGSILGHSHFATPISEEFNLAMLKMAGIEPLR